MAVLRRDRMTRDERMIALLNRQPLDRVPVWGMMAGFAALNVGYTIADAYGRRGIEAVQWTAEQYGFQDVPIAGSLGVYEFGGEMSRPSGEFDQAPIVTRYPAATEEQAWKLDVPDVRRAGLLPKCMETSKAMQRQGAAYMVLMLVGSWDMASYICSLENMCRWAVKKPELVHKVLRVSTDFLLQVARYWADAIGPDRLIIFSPHAQTSNHVVSPRMFQEFCLPYIKETHQRVLEMGYKHILCHICGEHNLNLPFWAQIPMGEPGIVHFGHEVDLDVASKHFPSHILMGNVNTAVIQTGTPQQVYEMARACIEKGTRHPSGYMLAPGCEMPPRAPPYNVWTMMKAISDFGWYE